MKQQPAMLKEISEAPEGAGIARSGNGKSQAVVEAFKALYLTLDKSSLSIEHLIQVYHPSIEFEDPLHKIHGIEWLFSYFEDLYENLKAIEFEFRDELVSENQAFLTWTMKYKHPLLNKGRWIEVEGSSRLTFLENKVAAHRDYFDAGAMLYEQIPALSFLIRQLKKRLGK